MSATWRRSGAGPLMMDICNHRVRQRRLAARLRLASRIDAWPAAGWLALQGAALWPVGVWAVRRVADGSDEPLGLVALGMLAASLATGRLRCRATARLPWLAAAGGLTLVSTAFAGVLPMSARALLAALAIGAAWAAFRLDRTPVLPVLGLCALALPVVGAVQFALGHPLRVLTAEASAALLRAAGYAVEVSGTSLLIDGRWVIVDAPCSGVQLAWLGYAMACAIALWRGLPDARFARRLPWVGVAALVGNIARNTVLVASEGSAQPWPAWAHDVVGLVALAAVGVIVVNVMQVIDGRVTHDAR